jgi:hypothetical protein
VADETFHDPLGRAVTLHDTTWYGYILKRHKELRGKRHLVGQTIRAPLEIRISAYDPQCRTCYGAAPHSGILVAVVMDVQLGLVKTAFFTTRMKGAKEW